MKDVFINKEHVELFKILKFEGIASSGAEAKDMIAESRVFCCELEKYHKSDYCDNLTVY